MRVGEVGVSEAAATTLRKMRVWRPLCLHVGLGLGLHACQRVLLRRYMPNGKFSGTLPHSFAHLSNKLTSLYVTVATVGRLVGRLLGWPVGRSSVVVILQELALVVV